MTGCDVYFGLSKADYQLIKDIFSRYPRISKAVIYGSRAMGNYRNSSDIDLTLVGDIDHDTLNDISIALDDLMLPYQFDLSLFDQIDNPALIEHIERCGKPLFP